MWVSFAGYLVADFFFALYVYGLCCDYSNGGKVTRYSIYYSVLYNGKAGVVYVLLMVNQCGTSGGFSYPEENEFWYLINLCI